MGKDPKLTRRALLAGAALAPIAMAIGLQRNEVSMHADEDGKIVVTCTIGMITDVVANVGGDRVKARGLMGPGIDPHLYKPSAGDINLLGDADIIFYGGLHLEGRMVETFEKIRRSGNPAFGVGESVPEEKLHRSDQFDGEFDPHIWFDVTLWSIVAETICAHLTDISPDDADLFAANLATYQEDLAELDSWILEQVDRLPESQRVLVTAHDAFGYFGSRYGFEVIGLQGLNTANEAGVRDVQDLAQYIVDHEIRAMFVESSVPWNTIEAVQEASRAKGWDVEIGGQLFSDAMGESGTPEGTYIGMVRANVTTIVSALLGEESDETTAED